MLLLAPFGGDLQLRSTLLEDLTTSALVAMQMKRTALDAPSQCVSQVLLAVKGALQQNDGGVLIDVLELLVSEASALRERPCEAQLAALPVSERLS
jgi:hypothetical protein